jgi:hypothetical protein
MITGTVCTLGDAIPQQPSTNSLYQWGNCHPLVQSLRVGFKPSNLRSLTSIPPRSKLPCSVAWWGAVTNVQRALECKSLSVGFWSQQPCSTRRCSGPLPGPALTFGDQVHLPWPAPSPVAFLISSVLFHLPFMALTTTLVLFHFFAYVVCLVSLS